MSTENKSESSEAAMGCGCLIIILVVIFSLISSCSHSSSQSDGGYKPGVYSHFNFSPDPHATSVTAETPAPDPTDPPTPKPTPEPTQESYEHQRQREKQEFLSSVDESISGSMIADNKFKYVGKNVDIHCTVSDIPDRNFFNANCGDEDNIALVVIQYDASGLSTGQAIRIIGTVEEPMEGSNAMGGSMQFPTVKAEFME